MNPQEQHKQAINELKQTETELMELVANTGDPILMSKFIEFQDKRIKCNEAYLQVLKCGL